MNAGHSKRKGKDIFDGEYQLPEPLKESTLIWRGLYFFDFKSF